ncbi:MAG TPA: NAD(P)-binding domain-containing protein, partial [Myxococcales bacterium]
MANRKVAIIGKGNVGSALQKGVEKAGYEVRATGSDAKDVRAAGEWAEIIILAVPGPARQDAIKKLGN